MAAVLDAHTVTMETGNTKMEKLFRVWMDVVFADVSMDLFGVSDTTVRQLPVNIQSETSAVRNAPIACIRYKINHVLFVVSIV